MIDPTLTFPAFKALETALNLAIRMLPDVQRELAEQRGRVVCLHCNNPEISLCIELGEQCKVLHTVNAEEREVDAGLAGDFTDWFELVRAEDKASELINGNLKMSGNSKWLLELGEMIGKLDIDWEGQLADIIGDVPAHLLGEGSRQIVQILKPISEQLREPMLELLSSALDVATGKSDPRQEFEKATGRLSELGERLSKHNPMNTSDNNSESGDRE